MRRQWTRSLPLRWRLIALLMVLTGLLALDGVLVARYTATLEEEQHRIAELRPVAEIPERLLAGFAGQQNSVRGYALTENPRFLRTYRQTQAIEGESMALLRTRLGDDPRLLALVEDFGQAAETWHRDVAEPVIRAERAGRGQLSENLVQRLDEPLFNALRDDAIALANAVDKQLLTSQTRAFAAGQQLERQLFTSSVLGIGLLLISGWLIRRWLTRPVDVLTTQLRRVASGHLHERVVGSGPGEFLQLGHDADVMRGRILEEVEESRRAAEALQQNAPLVVSLREQLIAAESVVPDGIRITARFEPAEGFLAGDWIQTLPLEGHSVGLVVVDVSGHGPEAGLRGLRLKHLLIPALNLQLEPADALHWAAGQVGDTGEWFATCVILEIDAETGRCLYANAGHPPALLFSSSLVQQILPTGPLFSDLPGARWDTARFTLEEDDLLVVYTDGITEARSPTGEEFGEDRLASCLSGAAGRDLDAIADAVMGEVYTFGGGRLDDDATLVLVSRQPVTGGPTGQPSTPEQQTMGADHPAVQVVRRAGDA